MKANNEFIREMLHDRLRGYAEILDDPAQHEEHQRYRNQYIRTVQYLLKYHHSIDGVYMARYWKLLR